MTYLLDTCIVSKLRKLKVQPDPQLHEWIIKHSESMYYLSVLTLGEIRAEITKLDVNQPDQQRHRMLLEDWLFGELVPRFHNRILNISVEVAFTWGRMSGEGKRSGNNVPVADSLIAATAIHHGLIIVTDNIKHFSSLGVEIIDPWNHLG